MENQITIIDPKEFGLEKKNVQSIEEAFKPKIAEREVLNSIYEQLIVKEIDQSLVKEAIDLGRKLMKVRTGISAIHKTQKAFALATGKFVDAWKNKETLPITQMEEKLSEIKNHFVKLEEERLKKIQSERVEKINPYIEDAALRNLSDMDNDVWDAYFNAKKKEYEDRIAAEKQAEQDRIQKEKEAEELRIKKEEENRAENERIRKENEKLKIKAENSKRIHKEKFEEEKRKKDAIAQQLKDREDAENKRIEDENKRIADEEKAEQDRIQAELNKGDSEKVKDLSRDLELLKSKYVFKSAKNKKMYNSVGLLIDKVLVFVK